MKKLSEIGRIYFSVFSKDGARAYGALTPEAALRFAEEYGLESDKDQDFIDGQFLTLEERRELVREVINAVYQKLMTHDTSLTEAYVVEASARLANEIIKEQGI